MLVIVSDLHLTDGASGETINPGAFRIFRQRVRDLALEASWRTGGSYRPIERIDLFLLGDILDVLRSKSWLGGGVRPWSARGPLFVRKLAEITEAILAENRTATGYLKSLHRLSIPAEMADEKPDDDPFANGGPQRPVEVKTHYLVGNHDWFFRLTDPAVDPVRSAVVQALGLCHDPNEPFPHDVTESKATREVAAAHQVFARHGDLFDRFNYEGNREQSSLGDAIVVELLSRFPVAAQQKFGGSLNAGCIAGLREIDNVRPLLLVPAWLHGVLKRSCSPQQALQLKHLWDELVDRFLGLQFVRDHDHFFRLNDLVDRLRLCLKFSQGVCLGNLGRLTAWWSDLTCGRRDLFYKKAFREAAYNSARFLVYGHTHRQELVPLDTDAASNAGEQMYVNTGTWRRVYELARHNPHEDTFLGYEVMTYAAFFKDDERGGRRFEYWTGGLSVPREAV
jgi:hypothetical protein